MKKLMIGFMDDGTALPFSASNTAWTVHFPTGALYVAWLDADPGAPGRQDVFVITNGWQRITLYWDGVAADFT